MTRALAPILSSSALPRPLAVARILRGVFAGGRGRRPDPRIDFSDHLLRDIGLTRHDLAAFDRRAR